MTTSHDDPGTCGDGLIGRDGDDLTCTRTGKHLIHRDAGGTRFVRAPGGALVKPAKPAK